MAVPAPYVNSRRSNRAELREEKTGERTLVSTKSGRESYARIAVPLRATVKPCPSIKKLNSSVAAQAVGINTFNWLVGQRQRFLLRARSNEHSRAWLNESPTFDVRTKLPKRTVSRTCRPKIAYTRGPLDYYHCPHRRASSLCVLHAQGCISYIRAGGRVKSMTEARLLVVNDSTTRLVFDERA